MWVQQTGCGDDYPENSCGPNSIMRKLTSIVTPTVVVTRRTIPGSG